MDDHTIYPEVATAIPADLLALISLNSRDGIYRLGGNHQAYRKQLRRFRDHYANAVDELQRLATTQGTASAAAWCHTLKGLTGNLGATALYAAVTAIDAQFRLGKRPDAAELAALRERFQEVMRDLDSLAPAAPDTPASAAAPLTAHAVLALLQRLADALEYDLGSAEALLTELSAGVRTTPLEPEIAAVAASAEDFAIDEALAQLSDVRERLKDTLNAQSGETR